MISFIVMPIDSDQTRLNASDTPPGYFSHRIGLMLMKTTMTDPKRLHSHLT
jgi:hypothetical protein